MSPRAPDLLLLGFEHWELDWTLDGIALLYSLLYVAASRRARRWPLWRTLCFLSGVGVALLALQSGVDAYDDRLLSDHMVQHLLLILPVSLLLALGRPMALALRATSGPTRWALASVLRRARGLSNPIFCLAAFSAVLLLAHLPPFYDATVRHPLLHDLEHTAFLLVGLLFWIPLLDGYPGASRRLGGLGRLIYVLAAMAPMALIGAYLNREPSLVYSAYAAPARALGISAVADQQQAGAIMWVGGGLFMVLAGLWVAMSTMGEEERRLQVRERQEGVPLPARTAGGPR